jgi:adenosylcobinamide kinase/adenosylcobinamide-phosphate guanylyltransferase
LSSAKIVLVLGGVRSGKSRFGQDLAHELGGNDLLFVATAESRDDEMAMRIQRHREDRPVTWTTLEQPLGVGDAIAAMTNAPSVILLDCLTLLVSNILLKHHDDFAAAEAGVRAEVASLVAAVQHHGATLVVVSGEVGMGVVPESSLGRQFRDLLGWANQSLAQHASATYLMVAGLPVNVTRIASTLNEAAADISGRAQALRSHDERPSE